MTQKTESEAREVIGDSQFINRITVSKVANLGNYENRKIEISVNFSKAENAGSVLLELERIIDDYNCTKDVDKYSLDRARRLVDADLEKGPFDEFGEEVDQDRLERAKITIGNYETLIARQASAIDKLNRFGGAVENNDAKEKWDSDDDNPY